MTASQFAARWAELRMLQLSGVEGAAAEIEQLVSDNVPVFAPPRKDVDPVFLAAVERALLSEEAAE